jgi:CDP-diacylglycerol--glycerol-3-phosphate 3-phosphatidyltransferase
VTLYTLKPRFQALLRPLVARLDAAGISPNQLTVAAAAGSVGIGLIMAANGFARWVFLLLPVWLGIRLAMNAMDGMLAREFGRESRLGVYLNELADVVSDAALYAPFAALAFGPFWTGLVILLAVMAEFAGVLGPTAGASRRYDGPMGKSDRAVVFGALGAWVGLGGPLPAWSGLAMLVVALLLVLTIVNRVRAGLAEARATP